MEYANIPRMPVGKYAGVRLDQLPMSYLRWITSQDFSPEIMEYARAKVKSQKHANFSIDVTRNAIDIFSIKFLPTWNKKIGIGTFIAMKATQAFDFGIDVSKNRRRDDEIVKKYENIHWVFNKNGDLKVLITCY